MTRQTPKFHLIYFKRTDFCANNPKARQFPEANLANKWYFFRCNYLINRMGIVLKFSPFDFCIIVHFFPIFLLF